MPPVSRPCKPHRSDPCRRPRRHRHLPRRVRRCARTGRLRALHFQHGRTHDAGLFPAQDDALAQTPADELLQLPMLSTDAISNSGAAYAIAKRANHLRVQAAAIPWGDRGARINSMSPGIIITPLARDEMTGP